jgi:N-acetylglutamate synthase
MTLQLSDIGRRVVIRYQLSEPVNGAHATDVLGVLTDWQDDRLSVTTKSGEIVTVSRADILAAKVVPPRTVTRREIREVETVALDGWRGLEFETLGGWVLRAADGFTRRANACVPLADPDRPLDAAIDAVDRWYAERGLPPTFLIPSMLGTALEPVLEARGWPVVSEDVLVMTAALPTVAEAIRADLPPVRVRATPDATWLGSYHYRGGELPAAGHEVLTNTEILGFASVDHDGENAAIARGTVTEAPSGRRWAGVTAVEVDPAHRRQGLGTHIVAGIAQWAGGHDATDVFLQVSATNTAALRTYERLGFAEHHRYRYRRKPSE